MTPSEDEFWFPAKQYGWGWGPPVTWQGWLVLAVYLVLVVTSLLALRQSNRLVVVGVLTLALIGVCWVKGERPRWRWGRED